MQKITAIILAGGKSSRMGTDKALIKLGEKTMLEMVIDACKPICSSILISSNNAEHGIFGYSVVHDEIPDSGPIGGIFSCLKISKTNWNFVISVDTPYITSEFIQDLFNNTENCDAVVPIYLGKSEPLIALYNKSCLPVIEYQIKNGQFKIHHLTGLLRTKNSDAKNWIQKTPHLFRNLNHPQDI